MPTYCYPYKRGTGWRSQNFRQNPGGYNPVGGHTGYDQAMEAGTELYAPGDGIVRLSSWVSDNYLANDWWLTRYGGDMLVIDCFGPDGTTATGPTFVLAHLSDSIAEVGQRVRKGQLVAISGDSGTATSGAHCHIEALPPNWDFNNGVYGRVDPETYFTEWPEDIIGAIDPQGTIEKEIKDIMADAEEAARTLLKMKIARKDKNGKQDGLVTAEIVFANFNQTMGRIIDRLEEVDKRQTDFASTTHQKLNALTALVKAQAASGTSLTEAQISAAIDKGMRASLDSITAVTTTTYDVKDPV